MKNNEEVETFLKLKDKKKLKGFYSFKLFILFVDSFKWLIKWSPILLVIFVLKEYIPLIAGTKTDVNIFIKYLTDSNISQLLPWGVAILCLIWGILERKFRQSKTKKLSDRIANLEKLIDPIRSSSDLQKTGKTKKGD